LIPIFQAILAAILFGASVPVAKLFLGEINPIVLAGLLYLGCGLGLFITNGFQFKIKDWQLRSVETLG
jgi:hypothetical protein